MIAVGIDIGTNSALMVMATVHNDGRYDIIDELHELPRLGELLDTTGRISDEAQARATISLQRFRQRIQHVNDGTQSVHVVTVATSALREASNGAEVCRSLEDALGSTIQVIDGQREAELTFRGAVGNTSEPTMMIDIGGGSTEYAVGTGGAVTFATTSDIGVVRFQDRYVDAHPLPSDARILIRDHVRNVLDEHARILSAATIVRATAGTPTALAMMDLGLQEYHAAAIDGHWLSRDRVDELAEQLCEMSLAQLRAIPGLDERRADIVPIGALILSESLHRCNHHRVQVSTRGLRHGALALAMDALKHISS